MNSLNRVIIFGATSAIAEHAARQLVGQGASLYCIGRNRKKLDAMLQDLEVRAGSSQQVAGRAADLADCSQHEALIRDAMAFLGTADGVLIAHGTLPDQRGCQENAARALQEINVNGLSVVSLLTLLANHFEEQRQGVIAVISSVAGDRGRQSNYVYGAAKGMVSIFAQGLRNRLAKSNVDVITIKPGFVDTPMTANFDKSGPLWVGPEQVAKGIVNAMRSGKGDVYLPWFWWGIMQIIKHIPEAIFKRLTL